VSAAARSLGELGDERVVSSLRQVAKDGYGLAKEMAETALQRLEARGMTRTAWD
jgi:HEAT repeat protein